MKNGDIMNDNILMENAIAFAAKAVKLREELMKEKGENLISVKLAECAADIGAEISGAAYSRSRDMHLAAHYEALSLASQCEYWIKLLCTAEYIDNKVHAALLEDCMDVKRSIIAAINEAREGAQ